MKHYVAMFIFLIASTAFSDHKQSMQDGITVDVTLEPTTITVGDSVSLQIVASTQDDKQLELANHESFGSFVVTDESNLLDIPNGNRREWTWSLKLDTFDANTDSLSGISIQWSDANGTTGIIEVEPIPVQVESVAGAALQDMELRDIKTSVPLYSRTWWPLAMIAVIFVCVVGVVFFFLKKKKRAPILPPHLKAMLAIQSLQDSKVDVVTFYTALSTIVRTYIEEQFEIAATGQTTREFLIAEKENPRFEHQDRHALADFLVAADLVKFAKFEPNESIWDEAVQRAKEFVSKTAPAETSTQVEVAA